MEPTQTFTEGEYKYSEPHSLDGLFQQQAGALLSPMSCSKPLRDITSLSSLTGCLYHCRSQASITFREALLRSHVLKDLSLLWDGQRWETLGSLVDWHCLQPLRDLLCWAPQCPGPVLLCTARAGLHRTQMRSTQSSGCP